MPVLTVAGAGVRHRRRWLFRDLDVTAEPGDIVAVIGVPGSGRTTVLLALTRHLRLSAGTVTVSGFAALGHVPEVTSPEPALSVAEHLREHVALLGRPPRDADAVIADGLYGLDPALQGWQLTPFQKQLLGLALARLSGAAVIALDGADDGLDAAEQARLWQILDELAAAGVAVVVTAREIEPERATTVVRLSDPQATGSSPASVDGNAGAGEGTTR
jgi:ABC-2 type transport system ATP-binding protein